VAVDSKSETCLAGTALSPAILGFGSMQGSASQPRFCSNCTAALSGRPLQSAQSLQRPAITGGRDDSRAGPVDHRPSPPLLTRCPSVRHEAVSWTACLAGARCWCWAPKCIDPNRLGPPVGLMMDFPKVGKLTVALRCPPQCKGGSHRIKHAQQGCEGI